ncbi:Immediate early response 3-interacting protein 1 [Balamuthia mandrillaris]
MAFTLGTLIEAALLFINALAILNEERFLRPSTKHAVSLPRYYFDSFETGLDVGWAYSPGEAAEEDSIKEKLIHLLHSIRFLLRIPLVGVNSVYIVYLLIFG